VRLRGEAPETALAFRRRLNGEFVLAIVPRLPSRLQVGATGPDLELEWPSVCVDLPSTPLFNVLEDFQPVALQAGMTLKELCGRRALALFSTRNSPHS